MLGIDNRNLFTDGSYAGSDEAYTPSYGVKPIIKYLPIDAVVWCPFDTVESEFVKQISKTNKVIYSHIKSDQDFFTYEPHEHWDMIISNPPYKDKRKFFERALSFNKPFALLMTVSWLNDAAPKELFKDVDLQLLLFNKRIKFTNPDNRVNNKVTFSSAYYCNNILPKQIVMENLDVC
ncbi:MAG: sugar-phosphate nucleotidyltransferase [Sulfurimonas sp.]|nr:sugar-phosphate nucleotidyltransferase [Sulfurimonas sp.]